MSKWHAATICRECWDERWPGRVPLRFLRFGPPEKCCFCGKENEDRIYVREDAEELHCEHAII